jgi:hypothetical protein
MKKPKLTTEQQSTLLEAYNAGTWGGKTGTRYDDRPKQNNLGPLFEKPKPVQAAIQW